MKLEDIIIRDPFVLVENGKYYMYGTRSFTCWGKTACGTDVYVSENLEEWSEPIEVFHREEGFFGEYSFWAPEVHKYKDAFYMFITCNAENRCKGTAILKAESPLGPFRPHSHGSITNPDWECLDGTFYLSPEGKPYMVFCREWTQVADGQVLAVELSEDLSHPVGEPEILFTASMGTPWVINLFDTLPEELKSNPDIAARPTCYVTDGTFLYRLGTGRLCILWSSFSAQGYTQSLAWSDNGDITGHWTVDPELLFEKDGGHGMIFTTLEGQLMLALHTPNINYHEHPVFYRIEEKENTLRRCEE